MTGQFDFCDIAVVGGGPAGLAVAIEARLKGHSVCVFERRPSPLDKACGEGLMPSGLDALERMGVLPHLERADSSPFSSITYVQEDGRSVTAALPPPGGLGIRRLALVSAMTARAREVGVELNEQCGVRAHHIDTDAVTLTTDRGETRAKVLVAADGLHSPLRRAEGLEAESSGPKRFGLRRHVSMTPWAPSVEVHFTDGAEAYVTPAGDKRVGIAFLWEADDSAQSFYALLERFPLLKVKIAGAAFDSEARGAGPLRQTVRARAKDRFVLVGDAAGYVDAITGEGLSLAFDGAESLGRLWPAVFADHGRAEAFKPYEREMNRVFKRYARLAHALVATARRPALRRWVLRRLMANPNLFEWALARAIGN